MAKYDKNSAEKWLNEHHFGYYNNEDDKGTGAEEIPTINRVFEAWDDDAEWLTADPVDQDREHANLYGGDREYCDECGRRLTMGEWGGYCSHCHPDYEDYEDEYLDDTTSEWELIDRKNVEDSDGFITEYSWYQRGDEHVMVFGDSDIYRPEDGDYDAEFDSDERAREWFSSYAGFTDHNEGIDKDRFKCLEDECVEEKPLNEAKTYRGIPNTIYVYHGDWSDPEVYINGKGFSEWDVEDYIWGDYVEACEDNGEEPTDEGFAKYCEENGEDLCNSFYYSNLEFLSAKEIVNEVQEYADDSLGMIYMVTDDYVEVIFNYPGHVSGADNFIHDLEDSYLGKENLIKIEKTDNSTGDELDPDDYEPEVIVKVTATPNSLSEGIDEEVFAELEEAIEEEDKPFTKSQIRDELRRETQKWTKKSDEIYYGFKSEYDYALVVLKKHYKDVEGEEKGDRFVIKFSNPNRGLKEGWAHFEFTSGSNPYIAKTEEEKKRLCNKWGKDCEFKGNIDGNDYYVINDKPVENDFAPLDENKEDDLYDYKTRHATGDWDRDDDDYLLNQDEHIIDKVTYDEWGNQPILHDEDLWSGKYKTYADMWRGEGYKIEESTDRIKIKSDKKVSVKKPDTSKAGEEGNPIQKGLKGRTAKLESKQLNEGPGAGYTLEGVIRVTGIETLKPVKYDADIYYGPNNSYDVTFECVGVGTIENFRFNSYYYGDEIDSADIAISTVKVNLWKEGGFEDIEAYVKSNLEDIRDCIVGARVESSYNYGGGYVHSKFDGTVCDTDKPLDNSYSAEYNDVCAELFAMDATIRDTYIIEYVDKAVTGDTYYDKYEVLDADGEYVTHFDTEEEAIEYAKKDSDADEVVRVSYHEMFNGDLDIEESETVWEREDDDFDESFKSIPGGKSLMESLVKTTLENYPNASSKVIARKTFDKSFEKHNITFEKWHKLVERVNK